MLRRGATESDFAPQQNTVQKTTVCQSSPHPPCNVCLPCVWNVPFSSDPLPGSGELLSSPSRRSCRKLPATPDTPPRSEQLLRYCATCAVRLGHAPLGPMKIDMAGGGPRSPFSRTPPPLSGSKVRGDIDACKAKDPAPQTSPQLVYKSHKRALDLRGRFLYPPRLEAPPPPLGHFNVHPALPNLRPEPSFGVPPMCLFDVGPLINPGRPQSNVIGVSDIKVAPIMAKVLLRGRSQRSGLGAWHVLL